MFLLLFSIQFPVLYHISFVFLKARMEILSPYEAKTLIIGHVNPQAPLPQSLINFVMKKLAGVFLFLLQRQALKIVDISSLEDENLQSGRSGGSTSNGNKMEEEEEESEEDKQKRREAMVDLTNPHIQAMRNDPDFYSNWLLPKFITYCKFKNWDIPSVPAISYFPPSSSQLVGSSSSSKSRPILLSPALRNRTMKTVPGNVQYEGVKVFFI